MGVFNKVAVFKYFILAILLYVTLVTVNVVYFNKLQVQTQKVLLLPPPKSIKLMTFGYNESFADSLWLSWSQAPEECGKNRILRSQFENDYKGYKSNNKKIVNLDLGYDRNKRKVCSLGWSYLMLDAITNLATKFRYAYLTGTTILSVLVEDHEGAALLYEKALVNFPKDWKLHYGAAYHYLFELDDIPRAARLLKKAGQLGAPQWVFSLSSKLYTKMGQAFLGISSLEQYKVYLKQIGDKDKLKEVDERIQKLKDQIKQ